MEGDACETLVTGGSIQGMIESRGQIGRYSFDANAGDNVFIETVKGEGMGYMMLEVFDPEAKL